jgi:excisionase family DNA binding protein
VPALLVASTAQGVRGNLVVGRQTDMNGELAPVPRRALAREEAAAALGMSLDSFERYVQPTIRMVRCGRLRLIPVAELDRWLSEHARRAV